MTGIPANAQDMSRGANNFYVSNEVTPQRVAFKNQYGMEVVGTLFTPKTVANNAKIAAIIVGHPMGAVKEQSSTLYAQKLAERGFVTLAIDLSYWGESEGKVRNAVLPDMYAEDFNAAVDYLGSQSFVDRERIGVLGICGSGSFAISAAKIDPRMKAVATVSMYDMGSAKRNGIGHSQSVEQRKAMLTDAASRRYAEFGSGAVKWTNGLPKVLPENADPVTREFHDFYRTSRGEVVPKGEPGQRSQDRTIVQEAKFVNFYPFNDIETISPRPMLFITGQQAHSREFSEDAYKRAAEPKEILIVPSANHVDLYDRADVIPWEKLAEFFQRNLNGRPDKR